MPEPPSTPATRESHAADFINDAPSLFRGVIRKAMCGDASPRSAIKAMCLSCTGYERADIRGCTSGHCPLWRYRPYQSTTTEEEE